MLLRGGDTGQDELFLEAVIQIIVIEQAGSDRCLSVVFLDFGVLFRFVVVLLLGGVFFGIFFSCFGRGVSRDGFLRLVVFRRFFRIVEERVGPYGIEGEEPMA